VLPEGTVRQSGRARRVLGRALRLVISPVVEWEAVAAENPPAWRVLCEHLVPLCLLPALGWAAGIAIDGRPVPVWLAGVGTFLLCLVSVVLHAAALNVVLPMYGRPRHLGRSCVVSAYAATPLLAVGLFLVWPVLMVLVLVTLPLGLLLVHAGAQRLLGIARADAAEYVAITTTLFVIASMALGAALGGLDLI